MSTTPSRGDVIQRSVGRIPFKLNFKRLAVGDHFPESVLPSVIGLHHGMVGLMFLNNNGDI